MEHRFDHKIIPKTIIEENCTYTISEIEEFCISKGFSITTDEDDCISEVFLYDCIHPNARQHPNTSPCRNMTEEDFESPPKILKLCLPQRFVGIPCNDANIRKIYNIIELWNFNDAYWKSFIPGLKIISSNLGNNEMKLRYKGMSAENKALCFLEPPEKIEENKSNDDDDVICISNQLEVSINTLKSFIRRLPMGIKIDDKLNLIKRELIAIIDEITKSSEIKLERQEVSEIIKEILPDIDKMIAGHVKSHINNLLSEISLMINKKGDS